MCVIGLSRSYGYVQIPDLPLKGLSGSIKVLDGRVSVHLFYGKFWIHKIQVRLLGQKGRAWSKGRSEVTYGRHTGS